MIKIKALLVEKKHPMKSQDREKHLQEFDEWIKRNLYSRELKRALGVKFTLQGWAYRAIAEVLNVSTSFISKWKKRYQEIGLEGLKLSYQGAKTYLTLQQKQEVLTCLKEQTNVAILGNLIRSHVIPLQMRIHRDVTFPSQSVVQAGVSRGDRPLG